MAAGATVHNAAVFNAPQLRAQALSRTAGAAGGGQRGSLLSPDEIQRQKEGYMKLLDEQLRQGQSSLDQQRRQHTDYLHQQAVQQKQQVEMHIKQQVQPQEMQLLQQYNQQLM
eukprot:CAMPEP_0179240188 /NCGR_PEP_ID=MMETSP0797-20121207/15847_1 /TAXON_ID=47934 /ORGANISM="Dinophysis acuminata, Strain DAEP01" /LENGTH=112 /DNA_ID=CAMNT_0020947533 /DNA_START=106 /DNA_END=441 /DNA_ORIENTATION=+